MKADRGFREARLDAGRQVTGQQVEELVRGLQACGLTQAVIAQATGTAERSVRNWLRTSSAPPCTVERLHALREIVSLLSAALIRRGVGPWLQARNRLLGGAVPIELLGRGEYEKVREAAAAYVDGSYV